MRTLSNKNFTSQPNVLVKENEEVEGENKAKFEKFMHDLLMDPEGG